MNSNHDSRLSRTMLRMGGVAVVLLGLAGCAPQELLHDLDEREANEIIVVLDKNHINAHKEPDASGGNGGNHGAKFLISVSASDATQAWHVLTDNQLPRKKDTGYMEVFATSGLIPTASEEKAKMLAADEGELAKTLKSIDGVLDARVHIVMPEDSVMRTKEEDRPDTTASVWFKYIARNGKPPVTEQQIKELVANAVEKLKPEKVSVIATPAMDMAADTATEVGGPSVNFLGVVVPEASASRIRLILAVFALVAVLSTLAAMVSFLRASGARNVPTRRGPPPPDAMPPPVS